MCKMYVGVAVLFPRMSCTCMQFLIANHHLWPCAVWFSSNVDQYVHQSHFGLHCRFLRHASIHDMQFMLVGWLTWEGRVGPAGACFRVIWCNVESTHGFVETKQPWFCVVLLIQVWIF
jgi:hypothetical protein